MGMKVVGHPSMLMSGFGLRSVGKRMVDSVCLDGVCIFGLLVGLLVVLGDCWRLL